MDYTHMVTGLLLVGLFFWILGFVFVGFLKHRWPTIVSFLLASALWGYLIFLVVHHAYTFS